MVALRTRQVWAVIEQEIFAVVGMVSAQNKAKTVGIVYAVDDQKIYFASDPTAWKVKHIIKNPEISLTVTIPKRIPLMPWIKIPPATVTFSGIAKVLSRTDVSSSVIKSLLRGLEDNVETQDDFSIIEITPYGDFITYGVGVSLMTMRDTEKARGRVSV